MRGRRMRRRRDPCGGGQDGWMAGSHAKERKEGGRMGGKMEGGEVMQDGGEGVNVRARACVCVCARKRQHPL